MTRRALWRRALSVAGVLLCVAFCAGPAQARGAHAVIADVGPPILPVANMNVRPTGFAITPAQALALAEASPAMAALHRTHRPLRWIVDTWAHTRYEVYFFFHSPTPLADVQVSPAGQLEAVWTGPLAAGVYARGKYGQAFDSPLMWIGFGGMFVLLLAALRGCSWLDRLDLAMLGSFALSYALFDYRHLEAGVWLAYPPLVYLMARMLARGRRATARRRIRVALPTRFLVGGLLILAVARVVMALQIPAVMDVGYASALGAHRILHGLPIYYPTTGHPDTYGPIAYLVYVPFAWVWPVTGWNFVPAARAATISFDLLTIVALVFLGRRIRRGREGTRLGLTLAWLWAACPFSVLGVVKGTNDGLIALLAVLMLLALSGPVKRGVLLGLAAAAKFFPAILLPLMMAGRQEPGPGRGRRAAAAFVITVGVSIALFLPPGGLREVYDHTIGFQLSRPDLFSPWALHPGLAPVKMAIEGGVALLAVALAFFPRGPRTVAQVSALAGALVIGVQLPALHWFYLYIVWFLPFVLVAVLAGEPTDATDVEHAEVGRESVGLPAGEVVAAV